MTRTVGRHDDAYDGLRGGRCHRGHARRHASISPQSGPSTATSSRVIRRHPGVSADRRPRRGGCARRRRPRRTPRCCRRGASSRWRPRGGLQPARARRASSNAPRFDRAVAVRTHDRMIDDDPIFHLALPDDWAAAFTDGVYLRLDERHDARRGRLHPLFPREIRWKPPPIGSTGTSSSSSCSPSTRPLVPSTIVHEPPAPGVDSCSHTSTDPSPLPPSTEQRCGCGHRRRRGRLVTVARRSGRIGPTPAIRGTLAT